MLQISEPTQESLLMHALKIFVYNNQIIIRLKLMGRQHDIFKTSNQIKSI